MSAATQKGRMRTALLRMVGGAIFGAAAMSLILTLVPKSSLVAADPSVVLALAASGCYLVIGLIVAVGMIAPGAGARFLNVEDSDEIREERPKLKSSTLVFFLTGIFLLVLALSAAGSVLLSSAATAAVAIACLAGIVIAGWLGSKHSDELNLRMGQEASSISFQLSLFAIGGWAVLAELGHVAPIDPLALLASLALLQLFVTFIVIGRRGLLIR